MINTLQTAAFGKTTYRLFLHGTFSILLFHLHSFYDKNLQNQFINFIKIKGL